MMQVVSLNPNHPDRSFSEVFATFQHHLMMDRGSDEVRDDQPAPQPHPIDPVSAPLDASARATIFFFNND
jgi:hypothetical protein